MATGRLRDAKNLVETLDLEGMLDLNRYLCQMIKDERTFISRQVKSQLAVGQSVSFTGNNGETVNGTVVAIKRKFAHVKTETDRWRVPMNVLNIEAA
jgi:hypothetical protein